MQTEIEKFEQRLELKERMEERDALMAIASMMGTKEGRDLFRYLFKTLEITTLPDMSMKGEILHDKLGFLRAGNSIYKLACQAASNATASIAADIEREKYDNALERYRIEAGLTSASRDAETDSNE
jgi:hypothetical protein